MKKKEKLLSQLLVYAGKRKVLTYLSMVIAGLSQLLALAPFLYIWLILRDVIAGNYSRIAHYGWMAVAFAIASIVVYFGGLMCSHVAAFRIAANMRKTLMQHIMSLPIGFLDTLGSGKVRKWVQESTQSTETYLAHQLPDKAGMYATMLGLAVLMFLFDWRMGLLCLGTVLLAIIVMVTLMTGPTLKQKMGEYNKALDSMSNEAVEYVRGIPVVKTYGIRSPFQLLSGRSRFLPDGPSHLDQDAGIAGGPYRPSSPDGLGRRRFHTFWEFRFPWRSGRQHRR